MDFFLLIFLNNKMIQFLQLFSFLPEGHFCAMVDGCI